MEDETISLTDRPRGMNGEGNLCIPLRSVRKKDGRVIVRSGFEAGDNG
jgi:hypothetical protein